MDNNIAPDCVVSIKGDAYRNLLRVLEIIDGSIDVRFLHPNRDISMRLPLKAVIYEGKTLAEVLNKPVK